MADVVNLFENIKKRVDKQNNEPCFYNCTHIQKREDEYKCVISDLTKQLKELEGMVDYFSKMMSLHDCVGDKKPDCPEYRDVDICSKCWKESTREIIRNKK